MLGYAGAILHVNLSAGRWYTEPLREDFAKSYIGGYGFGIALLFKHCPSNVDPLNPDNPLILAVGPLAGTMTPGGGGGHVFMSKSPQTFGVGLARALGHFGAELKRAGYDVVIFKGRSDRPVYVWIDDGSVQILNAEHLWGKSPAETEDAIREELGDYRIRVASIGIAGEKLARIASIISDKTRVAARTGMGAVMGSKNLKAIAVRGTNDVSVLDLEGFKEFVKTLHEKMRGPAFEKYRTMRTANEILKCNMLQALPTRNYNDVYFDAVEDLNKGLKRFAVKVNSCNSCPIGCEHIYAVPHGPCKGAEARIEYASLWALGPNCGVHRLDAVIEAVRLCNYYGIDAVSTGVTVAFAMECYEKSILNKEDLSGVDAKFGSHEALIALIHKIGRREGIGEILSEGVKIAAQKIGKDSEKLALHIKGVEITGYDLRTLKTTALGCAVSFRGDHTTHGCQTLELAGKLSRIKYEAGRAKIVKDMEDQYALMDSLILCKFCSEAYSGYDDFAKLYSLVTGLEITSDEMRLAAERIVNLTRLFNIREGLGRRDDMLPWKVMNVPIPGKGPSHIASISQQELNMMLEDYYLAREWNEEGMPRLEKLKELGLEEFANIVDTKFVKA